MMNMFYGPARGDPRQPHGGSRDPGGADRRAEGKRICMYIATVIILITILLLIYNNDKHYIHICTVIYVCIQK